MKQPNSTSNKFLALFCLAFLVFVLSACSGGGSDPSPPRAEPIRDNCGITAVPESGGCRTIAVRLDERIATSFTENGNPVSLELVLFRPLEGDRHPLVVMHHGSTGNGSDPSLFRQTFVSQSVVRHFAQRGWAVAFPQRRGRGQSNGLYDEGFTANRSGYSCERDRALAGAERALEDIDAITDALRARPDVDSTRMLLGGVSRGGILSIAHAARRPDVYLGVLNFVGGFIGEGCGDYVEINRTLFVEGAAFPGTSLWLYGANDTFYSLEYSRTNFAAFSAAGGVGDMLEFTRAPGLNGHFIINDGELWGASVDAYVNGL